MENTIKNIDDHCRFVALGAAQISYAIDKGKYSVDTKERTQIIATALDLYYKDALEQTVALYTNHDYKE